MSKRYRYEPRVLEGLEGWVWAPEALDALQAPYAGLLPPSRVRSVHESKQLGLGNYIRLPLRDDDGHDPLLMLITPEIQVALALQGPPGKRNLLMRSDPETFQDLLRILDLRLDYENPEQAIELRHALAGLGNLRSNENIQKVCWPLFSARVAGIARSLTLQTLPDARNKNHQEKVGH